MNKALKIILPIAGAAVAGAAATVFAIAPGRATEEQKAPFMRKNIAHRGLHKLDRSVPENSLAAFRDAASAGYGIELDVRMTSDGEVVVFHDDNLLRMCGAEGSVEEKTYAELCELSLVGTGERIPRFIEALYVIDGRVPVIVELKTSRYNRELCEETLRYIEHYNGDVCIESFDPRIVRWFRKNAPDVLRGQLAARPKKYGDDTNKPIAFILGNGLTNFLGRPQFVAYALGKKPFLVRLCDKLGAMRVAWTSHDMSAQEGNDAVIFEFYRPGTEY